MRFDDRLETILRQSDDPLRSTAASWSHILSVLAQLQGKIHPDQQAAAFERAEALRSHVPLDRRKFLAHSLANRVHDRSLVAHFAMDVASVAAPIMSTAQLDVDEWCELIAVLPTSSRALLRERRDLAKPVLDLLQLYGPSDRALPPSEQLVEDAQPVQSAGEDIYHLQITDLMARIEAYRQDRQTAPSILIDEGPTTLRGINFRFETDRAGVVNWVDGVSRGPVIGISFTENSGPRAFGVDGYAAGAFRKRAPFRDARLRVAGNSDASGDWLISADPCFDSLDGRFRGYRGYARRSDQIVRPKTEDEPLFGNDMSPDKVRQLVHELRSPINAIRGFAEMIDSQMLGPVSHPYRIRARSIISDSRRLIDIVESIDMAARLKSSADSAAIGPESDIVAMTESALDRVEIRSDVNGERFKLSTIANLPPAAVDFSKGSELLERIMLTAISAVGSDEPITINLSNRSGQLIVTIDRGSVLEPTIVDHAIGFALRVIKQCSSEIGGQFSADSRKFTLILPQVQDSEMKTIESI